MLLRETVLGDIASDAPQAGHPVLLIQNRCFLPRQPAPALRRQPSALMGETVGRTLEALLSLVPNRQILRVNKGRHFPVTPFRGRQRELSRQGLIDLDHATVRGAQEREFCGVRPRRERRDAPRRLGIGPQGPQEHQMKVIAGHRASELLFVPDQLTPA